MARLTHNQKLFVCQKIAERRTYMQIIKCFADEYEFPLTANQIHYLKERAPKWKAVIEEMRVNYDLAVSDLSMSSKRNRLEYLQECYEIGKEAKVEHIKYKDDTEKEVITKNPAAMVAAVRQAHEEMEGKSVKHKHSGKVKAETTFVISHIPPPDPLPEDIEEDE